MEMLERCPGCSVAREVEPAKAEGKSRPCAHCGYDGAFSAPEPAPRSPHRDSLPSFAGARAKLATATQDLFRLSGNHSIPVEAEPPPPAPEPPASSSASPSSAGRKAEASIMFSLEALMKTAATPTPPAAKDDEVSSQLWDMQAATPLFGTAQDQALLTTPLKMEPAQSMDSMTLPSHTPAARRWLPILVAAGAGLALAGAGIWFFGSSPTPTVNAATPPEVPVAVTAPPAAEPPPPVAEPVAPASAQLPPTPDVAPPSDTPPAAEATAEATTPVAGTEPAATAPKTSAPSKAPVVKKPPPRAVSSATKAAFDKGAAIKALSAAASQSAGCGAGGAPGKGKIQVTFAPSGKVSDAQLVEGPFGGTTAGKCALRNFRAAKVPAFSGAPVTVAKSFRVD
jgi:hypothetical protein